MCQLGSWRRCWAWGYTIPLLGCTGLDSAEFFRLTQWCFCSRISGEESSAHWLNIVLLLLVYRLLFHMAALSVVGGMRLFTTPQCTVTAQRFVVLFSFSEYFLCLWQPTHANSTPAACRERSRHEEVFGNCRLLWGHSGIGTPPLWLWDWDCWFVTSPVSFVSLEESQEVSVILLLYPPLRRGRWTFNLFTLIISKPFACRIIQIYHADINAVMWRITALTVFSG